MSIVACLILVLTLKCGSCVKDIENFGKSCRYMAGCSKSTNATTSRWLHPNCIAYNGGCSNQSRHRPEEDGECAERSVCRHAQTRSPGRVIPYTGSYKMVDRCPSQDGDTVLCDTLSTRLNGIYPVMSESGLTYINKECSSCNNDPHTVPWDIVMVCPNRVALKSFTPIVLASVHDGSCDITFLPPVQYNSTAQCLQSVGIVDPCNDVDNWDDFLQEVLISYHAIPAPVVDIFPLHAYQSIVYGNIYCSLCQKTNDSTSAECLLKKPLGPNTASLFSFTLNPLILEMEWTSVAQVQGGKPCVPNDLRHPYLTGCRRVHCPEGHVRDREGRCQLYALSWILGKIYIAIDLNWSFPGLTIKTSAFESLPEDKKSIISTWLHGPFDGSGWNVSVHYVVRSIRGKKSKDVSFLKVYCSLEASRIDAAALYSNITKAVLQRWTLEISGQTISLHAKVASAYPGKGYFEYLLRSQQRRYVSPGFFISKLFFCNQVHIYSQEYQPEPRSKIYIPILKKYLEPDEYIQEMDANTTYNSEGKGVLRVCVDDVLASFNEIVDSRDGATKVTRGVGWVDDETDFVKSTSFGVILCAGVMVLTVIIRTVCKRCSPRQNASTPDDVQMELSAVPIQGQLQAIPDVQSESETVAETAFN